MAKMNKIMPPRNTTIRGQDHLLAYITPEEAQMLMDNGGAGQPGPMGIPAFYDEGDDYSSPNATDADTGANLGTTAGDDSGVDFGGGDNDRGLADAQAAARANLERSLSAEAYRAAREGRAMVNSYSNPYANSGLSAADRAYNTVPNAQRVAQSYFDYSNIFDPSVYSSKMIGGDLFGALRGDKYATLRGVPSYSSFFAPNTPERKAFADMAIQQMKDQQRLEKAGNSASPIAAMIGSYNVKSIMEDLENGGRPALDKFGKVQGVFSEGPFGEVYQGNPIEGLEETGWTPYDTQGGYQDQTVQTVQPPNPATGQCDEGYIFDTDLQACRLDTGGDQPSTSGATFAPGAYARMGLLDQAPTGLPEFQQQYGAGFGTPSEFTDANLAFRRQGAYRPEYFDQPYPTTGYTLLS